MLEYHVVEAFRWFRCKSLHIFGHSISCRPIVSHTLQLFCPRKCQLVTLARKLDGCRVVLDRVVMKECPVMQLWFLHVVSYVTLSLSVFIDDVSTAWFMLYQIEGCGKKWCW